MLTIYTRTNNPFKIEFWKWLTKRITGKKDGPYAVLSSLVRGLRSLKTDYNLNPLFTKNIVLVLSGSVALSSAIQMKKLGMVKKLIAGPNVTVHPHDAHRIMLSDMIDIILVPSEWVADLWVSEAPELASKIKVWPSGVETKEASTRTGKPIIYDKLGNRALLSEIQQKIGYSTHLFTYGSFNHKDYLSALRDAPYLIYLSKSESQGLALQEAWAHDVPTLVNQSTNWKDGQTSWEASQINCPYLTPELGTVFETSDQIPSLIFQISELHPKSYCDEHLSDRVSAEALMKLL